MEILVNIFTTNGHTISMREELKKPLLEVVKVLGITLFVYVLLRFLLPLVFPFFLGFLLAKQLNPIIEKLYQRFPVKRGILVGAVILLLLVITLFFVWILGKNLILQLQSLFYDFPWYKQQGMIFFKDCCMTIESLTGIEAETLQDTIIYTVPDIWEGIKGTMLPVVMTNSISWIKGIFMIVGVTILIGVSTLLFLKEYEKIKESLQQNLLGQIVFVISKRVYQAGGGYLKAQLYIMVAVSVVCVAGLFFTGNSYALLAGLGIAICDVLPFLGTGTVFIPWALIEMIMGHYTLAAAYALIYTIANLTRELLEPRLVGEKLGISPIMVMVSVYVGICVYGILGFALGPLSYILVREIYGEFF